MWLKNEDDRNFQQDFPDKINIINQEGTVTLKTNISMKKNGKKDEIITRL